MTRLVRPLSAKRRRLWIAVASVFSIAVVMMAVGATRLKATRSQAVGPRTTTAVDSEPAVSLPRMKWTLSWSDEFNGQGLPTKWTLAFGNGTNGWSHRALQYYQAANVTQDGLGHLVITADKTSPLTKLNCWNGPCSYTSGRVETRDKFSQRYGRFAARIKLPADKGIWPAFWMRSTSPHGEIDIVETGSRPELVNGYVHVKGRRGAGSIMLSKPFSASYHVYGVDWTPQGVVWWMDGKPYGQFKYSGWPLNEPLWMILNVQVAGNYSQSPNAATRFPARMEVDWVRVYRGAAM